MELLTKEESAHFLENGFVYIRHAFAAQDAEQMCDFLWTQITPDKHDRNTWTEVVCHIEEELLSWTIRSGVYSTPACSNQ